MKELLLKITDKTTQYSFYLLFFLVPLVLTPFNYELFEYNKMMATYALTIVIVGAWTIKTIVSKQLRIARTPLDIPIILFLLSQIVSTFFSIDRHVSLFGYYSRFNGGLLSTISYILLYYAFVSNFPKEKIKKLLIVMLTSGILICLYGILEHFGIDKDIWVQDVQNRVFSTLGQPNWLAAYLAVLIPITIGLTSNKFSILNFQFSLNSQFLNFKTENLNFISNFKFKIENYIGLLGYWVIGIIFYVTLIFTKSRSGFLGLWISLIVFWLFSLYLASCVKTLAENPKKATPLFFATARNRGVYLRFITFFIFSLVIITFFLGAPFSQINRFTFSELFRNQQTTNNKQQALQPSGSSIIDVGITESGTIRRIVWKGAIEIFKHYPLFGTGVETFAFAYYKFRPVEHNMTSEWDFLYNKAHNEYLNYAATTGIFGLGSYLLFILFFILWSIRRITYCVSGIRYKENIPDTYHLILNTGLFSAWLSILITNFFGFSVVIIQLFFFLIPSISFVLSVDKEKQTKPSFNYSITNYQLLFSLITLFAICYLLFTILRLWYADTFFASGYHSSRASDYLSAYQSIKEAIKLNKNEPLYYDELALPAVQLAIAFDEEKQATYSSYLRQEATLASELAVTLSPNNVNFWKTRTRVFYTLAQLDEKYLNDAFTALVQTKTLSPTDPKISYNLGLLYDKLGKKDEAIAELYETTKLKPDYRDAYFALGLFYQRDKQKEKAKEAFNFILTKIATDDAEAKKMLEDLK